MGWDFLLSLDREMELPKYASGHGYSTVGEILDDNELELLNEEIQEDYIDANIELLLEELGLDEGDLLPIPAIYEEVSNCQGSTVSLIPGTVNMTVLQPVDEDTTYLLMPDPFMRGNNADLDEGRLRAGDRGPAAGRERVRLDR